MRAYLFATLVALAAMAPGASFAQVGAEASSVGVEAQAPRPATERRAVPDYDGRPDAGPSAEDVLIWLPRILLGPVHLVLEYLVRAPLGALFTAMEREEWHVLLADFFTWDERHAGLVPTAFYDFGFAPSVGLYFFWNDVGAPGHQLRVSGSFGGIDFLRASVWDRVLLSRAGQVEWTTRVEASTRPDRVFQGLGALSRQEDRARFEHSFVEGLVRLDIHPWRGSRLGVQAGVGWQSYDPDGYAPVSDDPSLATAVQQGHISGLPPGFGGYVAYRQRLELRLDTREVPPAPRHGIKIDALVEQGVDLTSVVDRRWIRYGGVASAFVDVGNERVFSLHVVAELADPLGEADVPFLEQAALGGSMLRLPGFLQNQLIGRSATVATLRYTYPVWVYLDASLFVSAGNVFDAHFSDFDPERLRLAWGFGLASIGDRDHGFELTLAFGTTPFVLGATVESVRLMVGGQAGFF